MASRPIQTFTCHSLIDVARLPQLKNNIYKGFYGHIDSHIRVSTNKSPFEMMFDGRVICLHNINNLAPIVREEMKTTVLKQQEQFNRSRKFHTFEEHDPV